MSRFRISLRAKQDLEEIADYLGERNPPAALKVLDMIFDRVAVLATQPLLGEVRDDLPGHPRVLCSGNYLILYQPASDGVDIARIVHAARDVKSLLRREQEPNAPGPTGPIPG